MELGSFGKITRFCGIYEIRNSANDKVYVGSAKDIFKRWHRHINALNNGNHFNEHLQNAWKKYGKDCFSFSIIEVCSFKELAKLEDKWIINYNTLNREFGYNKRYSDKRMPLLEETKKKLTKIGIDFFKNNPEKKLNGEKNSESKLRVNQVLEILEKWSSKKNTQKELGKLYSVSPGTIFKIVSGERWVAISEEFYKTHEKRTGGLGYALRKFNKNTILEILQKWELGIFSQSQLGVEYSTSQTAISRIVLGKRYKDVYNEFHNIKEII